MVQEDEEGGIQHSVDSFMARARRKRYAPPLHRDSITDETGQ